MLPSYAYTARLLWNYSPYPKEQAGIARNSHICRTVCCVVAFFPPHLLLKKLNVGFSLGELALRASFSLAVIAFALVGSMAGAVAQYYPPPPPPSDYPPPPAYPYPSYQPQPYSQAPLPAPVQSAPAPYGGPSPIYREENSAPDPRYGQQAVPDNGFPPQPMPSVEGGLIPRPPANVGSASAADDVTGTVPASTAAPAATDRAATIAALPPEDQPEQGPPKELPPQFRRQLVDYQTSEPVGTIIVDTPNTYLYLVLGNGKALRYGIGVGREGFTWTGTERIRVKKEWPDWFPPREMIERQPYLPRFMAGGESNPLGARALYLGNTLYRIHGTNQPSTIGTFVSSGCIRLTNEDIEDLYDRVTVGTRVVVLPGTLPSTASAQDQIAR
jgi:lipoprotein-anchoring transpeptidase ErfK/SrfK